MLYFIFAIIILLNLFAMRYLRKNNLVVFLTVMFFLLLTVWNMQGPDIDNYFIQYKNASITKVADNRYQFIYNTVMRLFARSSASFFTYRFIVSLIAFIIIIACIIKLKANVHTVLIMYALIQFFLDGVQLRNFLALPFLILAVYFALKKNTYWKLLFIVSIVIASLIHNSFLVYLVFLLLPDTESDNSKLVKTHAIISLILCMIFMFGRDYINIIVNILDYFDTNRAMGYSVNSTNLGPVISIFLQASNIVVSYYLFNKINKVSKYYEEDGLGAEYDLDVSVIKRIFWINVIGLYLVPFSFVQLTFYRLIRNLLFINFISFGILNKYYKRSLNLFLVGVCYIGVWQIAEFIVLNTYSIIVKPFFEFNYLLH